MLDLSSAPAVLPRESADTLSFEGMTVFHEEWWLDAATGGAAERVELTEDGGLVGILPYLPRKRFGLSLSNLPAFCHVLGAAVAVGDGSPNARLHRRFDRTLELLGKLPRFHYFRQCLDHAVVDALAYQAAGFIVSAQYTILLDCGDMDAAFAGMRQKTRRFIRRAQERYEATVCDDPEELLAFMDANLRARNLGGLRGYDRFLPLYAACRARDAGKIFVVRDEAGALQASLFVTWGHGTMYYLLTSRTPENKDFGIVSLLVWRAMAEACARRLVLDLDGIINTGIYRFLSGFGGVVAERKIVIREAPFIKAVKPLYYGLMRKENPTYAVL